VAIGEHARPDKQKRGDRKNHERARSRHQLLVTDGRPAGPLENNISAKYEDGDQREEARGSCCVGPNWKKPERGIGWR
jgi:Mg-chelatase subunit ChlD